MALARRAPYLAYRLASAVAPALPGPVAEETARALGLVFARAMRGRRRVLERHLRRVHGAGLSGAALERAVAASFDSYARYWLEAFRLSRVGPAALEEGMAYEGLSSLREALARGRGAILALPHLGGWDFGGAWLASTGVPVTVVVEPVEPPELFGWFVAFRRSLGMEVVPLGPRATRDVLAALAENRAVGLLCDRDITGGGVEVEFFGERTTLPGGPALLALRSGAALLPTAIYFEGSGHRGVVRPPVAAERRGSLAADVARITQALAAELEILVRRAPEQWHLFQPNWPSDRDPPPERGDGALWALVRGRRTRAG